MNLTLAVEHCVLSYRKEYCVKAIRIIKSIACQAFYLASNLKAIPLFLNLHICIPLI